MAVEYEKAPDDVLEVVGEAIERWHPRLQDARIGILLRPKAPKRRGARKLGAASLISARMRPLMKQDLDFIIWFAADVWYDELDHEQRLALVDHELCHCAFNDKGKPGLRAHDLDEFVEIVERHGAWKSDIERLAQAVQQRLALGNGEVVAIEPGPSKRDWAEVLPK